MNIKDQTGVASRRRTARRLQKFFAEWTAQLGAGTSEIWRLVEDRLAVKNEAEGTPPHAGDLPCEAMQPQPMQQKPKQQPMQQQQTKASPKKILNET